MLQSQLLLGLVLAIEAASAHPRSWGPRKFTSLVSFGDSYTDQSRLNYFGSHNGSAPPVGWEQPDNNNTASGGYVWGHYVSQYADVNLYNYAVSGAVCSNEITPRTFSYINDLFPSVLEYEVPAFLADSKHKVAGKKFLDIPPRETVYSIWIGTNDLGNYAFITDSQVKNKTIPDYINCVYTALDQVYANGGRYFVLMNLAPLQLAPLYATPENGGVGANQYWPDKPDNLTLTSYRMWEQVATANDVFKYQTPYEVLVARRYPGAQFAVMDMYGLLSEVYYNPTKYFNGSAPANVTGFNNHCPLSGGECTRLPSPDSFMWFDELHPSQRTDQIIAEEFVKVVRGDIQWPCPAARQTCPHQDFTMSRALPEVQPPPYPIAIRPESITRHEVIVTVTNRPEPWHSLDYSIEHAGTELFTVRGQPWKISQARMFHDRSGLPLFELRCQWYDSSSLCLRLPGGDQCILEAKLRVAINAPRAVVTFRNAAQQPRSAQSEEIVLEVHAQDLYNILQVVVVQNRNVAYIHRITDRSVLAEGQRPPFRFRPKWMVRVAEGVDLSLIAVVVVIVGQRAGLDVGDG
ncbi:hypothetical protein CNMCM6936_001785 [Aspergillus lentulus]|nr:hypothetical protein CNMCM6069_000141 [Aspergillus lentulus]KAF4162649.1 hypothetical protein CNMCM6936_001785 [Aspergillus lentulus]KAF4172217.1 hypothetical protein CNMCM8060_001788 [Aspergillus lentulus]KAF4179427.1 hypothetical protein CNMCM7927_001870 [Aspergillus lentulus]KAF4195392.1 hypothetical protein CNMCM8694_006446 [Aspergillus lentulus]